ncbi:MAG: hypothetical protein ABSD74_15800 [Rhizomicrobium sp.]|jgi:hypothetical protein
MRHPDNTALKWPSLDAIWRFRGRIELQGALGLALWLALVVTIVRAGNG